MKKTFLLTLCCSLVNSAYSQDKLHTHKGDTLDAYIKEVSENSIKFIYPNEESINIVSKNLIEKIIYKNGRQENITKKIIIKSEKDWNNVILTSLESDVMGLSRGEEIMAKASSGWSTTNEGKMQKLAIEKLKKEAAKKGYHVVLLLTTTSKGGGYGISGGTKSSITGIGYKY